MGRRLGYEAEPRERLRDCGLALVRLVLGLGLLRFGVFRLGVLGVVGVLGVRASASVTSPPRICVYAAFS